MAAPLIVFDLETGGLQLEHPIIEVGAVVIDRQTGAELECYEAKVQFDEAAAEPEALKINHYDSAVWAEHARTPLRVLDDLSSLMNDYRCIDMMSKAGKPYRVAQLAAYNAEFDGPRLKRMFGSRFLPAHPHVLCARQLVTWRRFFRGTEASQSTKLVDACAEFGIQIEKAHSALADARAAARLIVAIQQRGKAAA